MNAADQIRHRKNPATTEMIETFGQKSAATMFNGDKYKLLAEDDHDAFEPDSEDEEIVVHNGKLAGNHDYPDNDDDKVCLIKETDIAFNTPVPFAEESFTSITLQICFPFIIAGLGMVGAGLVLDVVQHWVVFETVNELFILVPALLGLKGNLEMTLASRLSTQVKDKCAQADINQLLTGVFVRRPTWEIWIEEKIAYQW